MARLLVGGEWYEAVASTDFFEVHFEALLSQHASYLYPDYFLVPFKTPVRSDQGTEEETPTSRAH